MPSGQGKKGYPFLVELKGITKLLPIKSLKTKKQSAGWSFSCAPRRPLMEVFPSPDSFRLEVSGRVSPHFSNNPLVEYPSTLRKEKNRKKKKKTNKKRKQPTGCNRGKPLEPSNPPIRAALVSSAWALRSPCCAFSWRVHGAKPDRQLPSN